MKVDVLHAGGCVKCRRVMPGLRAAAQVDPGVEWRELDVASVIDYAVELGALAVPAVAIEGALVFRSLPTAEALRAAMRTRLPAP